MSRTISRRAVLRGAGVAVALPWLESVMPRIAGATPGEGQPRRMVFFSVPNGIHIPDWKPKQEGPLEGELPPSLQPLAAFRSSLLVLSGLALDGGRPYADGPGDHARSAASFLTAAHPFKTAGKDIRNGVSVDQVAAARIGGKTRFPSLELGCDPGAQAGNCDSGYSCAYTSNISWRTPASPMAKEISPRAVFERLFAAGKGDGGNQGGAKSRGRRSVLDFVAEDARQLHEKLDAGDRRKLDEYLYAVRQIEQRLEGENAESGAGLLPAAPPAGTPKDYGEHARLLMDMLALALQTDSTRIATFMFANEGSNRSYPQIEVRAGHHELSHHGGDPAKQAQLGKINRYHVGLLAHFVEKLAAITEGTGTLLDRCMVMHGSGLSDGNRHNHDDLPIVLVGGTSAGIRSGRHLVHKKETPLANLYLTMLDLVGAGQQKFGDSTGRCDL